MTAPRRRICVMQIPSATRLTAFDNARTGNTVARRAGVPFSFATFLLGKQKKSRLKSKLIATFQRNSNRQVNVHEIF